MRPRARSDLCAMLPQCEGQVCPRGHQRVREWRLQPLVSRACRRNPHPPAPSAAVCRVLSRVLWIMSSRAVPYRGKPAWRSNARSWSRVTGARRRVIRQTNMSGGQAVFGGQFRPGSVRVGPRAPHRRVALRGRVELGGHFRHGAARPRFRRGCPLTMLEGQAGSVDQLPCGAARMQPRGCFLPAMLAERAEFEGPFRRDPAQKRPRQIHHLTAQVARAELADLSHADAVPVEPTQCHRKALPVWAALTHRFRSGRLSRRFPTRARLPERRDRRPHLARGWRHYRFRRLTCDACCVRSPSIRGYGADHPFWLSVYFETCDLHNREAPYDFFTCVCQSRRNTSNARDFDDHSDPCPSCAEWPPAAV